MNKEEFIREFMEDIWNNKNFDKVEQYVHPEYTIHLDTNDPWERKTLSHKEFIERLNFSFSSFPDMNFEITSSILEDDHVAITWILSGTNLGMIAGYPATNKSIRTAGIIIYHFKDDLISGHTQVFDRITVMEQLGFS